VPATPDPDRAAEILALVRVIPEGFVVSYGELSPEAPRFAGSVLAATEEPGLPWHRVVRADGSLAQGDRQRRLLVAEGSRSRARGCGWTWCGSPARRSSWSGEGGSSTLRRGRRDSSSGALVALLDEQEGADENRTAPISCRAAAAVKKSEPMK
jgi:alkylated DNA nucleotide flippase Atl1